jgi:signal transduction histidine kinase
MFDRTRRRLTLLYIGLFGLIVGAFSVVVYVALATTLAPTLDIEPELTSEQVAQLAFQATLDRLGVAIVVADILVLGLVAIAAWFLAARTLRPIAEAHARQRRFVADASHEMRTPLAAIRVSAEGALAGRASANELRRALGVVVDSAGRLSNLTNDLLLLARADALPPARTKSPVDLSVVVAETAEAFVVAHPELPRATTTLAPDLPVMADPDELRRIVANLLDNAYRYGSRQTGAVPRVTTRMVDRDAVVDVADDGPGIAATDLERVFDPFARLHPEADSPAGSGLGLAIARSLAQRNGGRLTVTSQPNAGATFRLWLPRLR